MSVDYEQSSITVSSNECVKREKASIERIYGLFRARVVFLSGLFFFIARCRIRWRWCQGNVLHKRTHMPLLAEACALALKPPSLGNQRHQSLIERIKKHKRSKQTSCCLDLCAPTVLARQRTVLAHKIVTTWPIRDPDSGPRGQELALYARLILSWRP